jgi:hypothetical protein
MKIVLAYLSKRNLIHTHQVPEELVGRPRHLLAPTFFIAPSMINYIYLIEGEQMNRNQKIVIFIALVLFLCCGIFVPYDGTQIIKTAIYASDSNATVPQANWANTPPPRETGYDTGKTNLFIGYFPIFSPPSRENISKPFPNSVTYGSGVSYSYESNINFSRLIIQMFILLIITAGLFLLFAGKNIKD